MLWWWELKKTLRQRMRFIPLANKNKWKELDLPGAWKNISRYPKLYRCPKGAEPEHQ